MVVTRPNQVQVPAIFTCDGSKVDQLLSKWMNKPDLEELILVSYAFNPEYRSKDASLGQRLERIAGSTDVTLVTTIHSELNSSTTRNIAAYKRLVAAGVRVLNHKTLHAKTFLFRRGAKVLWVVGSSNLTAGGLLHNEEVNVAGYKINDYQTVYSEIQGIIEYAHPL